MIKHKIIIEILKQLGLFSQAKLLWIVHPMLEEMTVKFADYVGPHSLTEDGKNLLPNAIRQAMYNYQVEKAQSDDEHRGFSAYVRTLLACSIEVFAQQLVAETANGDAVWSPFACGAVEFERQFEGSQISNTRVE